MLSTLGTVSLKKYCVVLVHNELGQTKSIKLQGVSGIDIMFDGDGGRQAAEKAKD